MLFEEAHCKKEKEHRRNVKHQVDGKCKLTHLVDCSKNVQDTGNVKCVENGHRPSHDGSTKSKSSSSSRSKRTTSSSSSKKSSSSSQKRNEPKNKLAPGVDKCFDQSPKRQYEPCKGDFKWQHAEYYRDECGSGIRPLKMTFAPNRKFWCATPLSTYQSTIGELARKILCDEFKVLRNVNSAPPCNVCEYSLPLCRGYYRKYDCIRGCEEEYATHKNGEKVYRDRVQRYWEPCLPGQKSEKSVRHYAQHNAYLGEVVRRKFQDSVPCW